MDRTGKFWQAVEKTQHDEFTYILNRMFWGYQRIDIIKTTDEGLSKNKTFFIRPIKEIKDETGNPMEIEYNPRLVKIGPKFEIAYEEEHYNLVIDGYLDTFIGMVVKDSYVESRDLAGIMYTSVGASKHYIGDELEYPKTLRQFIEDALVKGKDGVENVIKRFDGIYTKILHGLYRNNRKQKKRILGEYSHLLPSLLTLKFRGAEKTQDRKTKKFDLGVVEDSEPKEFSRVEEYRIQMLSLRPGDQVFLEKGKISEVTGVAEHRKGRIRLFHPGSNLKIDVQAPESDLQSFESLINDRRLRKGKIIRQISAEVEETAKGFLQKRFNEKILSPLNLSFLRHSHFNGEAENGGIGGFIRAIHLRGDLPEPISFIFRTFDYHYTCDMTFSTVHGDLNLGNILIAGQGEDEMDYWLVDFAKAREWGHTAFEFVKLELEIRTQILSNLFHGLANELLGQGREREEVYKGLFSAYLLWENQLLPCLSGDGDRAGNKKSEKQYEHLLQSSQGSNINPLAHHFLEDSKVKGTFRLISHIRGKALASAEVTENRRIEKRLNIEPEDYMCSLILYSISALKFNNLLDKSVILSAPLPAFMSYLCCAVACGRLSRLVPEKISRSVGGAST